MVGSGLLPGLAFYMERKVTQRVKAQLALGADGPSWPRGQPVGGAGRPAQPMNDAFGTAPQAGFSVKSPSPQPSTLVLHWQTHWTSVVALVLQLVVLAWYLRSVRRLTGRERSWSPFRTAGFVAGLVVLAYAVEGGLAYYDVSNFTVSVIQHLLLITVAPPLLAMGAPVTLALQSSSPRTTTVLLKVFRGCRRVCSPTQQWPLPASWARCSSSS